MEKAAAMYFVAAFHRISVRISCIARNHREEAIFPLLFDIEHFLDLVFGLLEDVVVLRIEL